MSRWLLLSTLLIAACRGPSAPPLLVLEPESAGEAPALPAERLGELRALTGLTLRLDRNGCDHPGASHRLRVTRQYTETQQITTAELVRCADRERRVQNFVQPRGADRDLGRAVAFWAARQLE